MPIKALVDRDVPHWAAIVVQTDVRTFEIAAYWEVEELRVALQKGYLGKNYLHIVAQGFASEKEFKNDLEGRVDALLRTNPDRLTLGAIRNKLPAPFYWARVVRIYKEPDDWPDWDDPPEVEERLEKQKSE